MVNLRYVIHVDYSTNSTEHIDLQRRKKKSIDETEQGKRDIVLVQRNQWLGILLMRGMMRLSRLLYRNLHLGERVKGGMLRQRMVGNIRRPRRHSWYISYRSFWDNLS